MTVMSLQSKTRTTLQEHPLTPVVTHWVHLVSIAVLVWTGFFIHNPFYSGSMQIDRTLHFIFMFLFIFSAVVRLYWSFVGFSAPPGSRHMRRDYTFFAPEEQNKGSLVPLLRYYFFLQSTPPKTSKYNPLQKAVFALWGVLIALQAITGFELWTPTSSFFLPLTYALGGPVNVRIIHYLIMWIFISTVTLHIYLVLTEEIREVPLMFWRQETASKPERERA
ncbi:MAG: Ni/Fe-hydrogenase, b-type cytochrome subunit [Firmicutes bacterium]|nr:Ni/Fe-hydrogenase, b-type cytochrome subunit [Bacillota bacterium]